MIPDACMAPTAEHWQRPTPAQIQDYMTTHGLTGYRVKKMLGVSSATPGRWLSGEIEIQFCHWSALVRAVEAGACDKKRAPEGAQSTTE